MSVDLAQRISVNRDQAAELLGVSKDTVIRAVRKGELVEHYVSARPVILVDDLRSWISAAPTKSRGT